MSSPPGPRPSRRLQNQRQVASNCRANALTRAAKRARRVRVRARDDFTRGYPEPETVKFQPCRQCDDSRFCRYDAPTTELKLYSFPPAQEELTVECSVLLPPTLLFPPPHPHPPPLAANGAAGGRPKGGKGGGKPFTAFKAVHRTSGALSIQTRERARGRDIQRFSFIKLLTRVMRFRN